MTYLVFTEEDSPTKTRRWRVDSKSGHHLGTVRFWSRWRCYTFHPWPDTVFNAGCLEQVAEFCARQTATWRAEVRSRGR